MFPPARHCEERSDEAIQGPPPLPYDRWFASSLTLLAMTALDHDIPSSFYPPCRGARISIRSPSFTCVASRVLAGTNSPLSAVATTAPSYSSAFSAAAIVAASSSRSTPLTTSFTNSPQSFVRAPSRGLDIAAIRRRSRREESPSRLLIVLEECGERVGTVVRTRRQFDLSQPGKILDEPFAKMRLSVSR